MLIDTSVLVALFKDRSGATTQAIRELLEDRDYYLTRFTQMELLQGARDEREWLTLSDYLADQDYLETTGEIWAASARLTFDLRRRGLGVRSAIDCCVAEIAMTHNVTLLHNDRDFVTIAKLRSLKHVHLHAPPGASFNQPAEAPCAESPATEFS